MENMPEKYPARNGFSPRFGIIPCWVLQLNLTRNEYRTLHAIAGHADKTRCTRGWSVETIAADAGLDRANVHRAIRGLKKKGVLEITPGGGRGRANSYQIIFEPTASPQNSVTSDTDLNSVNGDAVSDKTVSPATPQNSVTSDTPSTEDKNQKRTLSNESDARARARCSFAKGEGDFAIFWQGYPHKVDEAAARTAYAVAIRGEANPSEILDGLKRYIASKPEDRHWMNPTTFLQRKRWRDQPAPAAQFNGHSAFNTGPTEPPPTIGLSGSSRQGPGRRLGGLVANRRNLAMKAYFDG